MRRADAVPQGAAAAIEAVTVSLVSGWGYHTIQSGPKNITMTTKPNIALAERGETGAYADLRREEHTSTVARMVAMNLRIERNVTLRTCCPIRRQVINEYRTAARGAAAESHFSAVRQTDNKRQEFLNCNL